jgi:predicted GIY-YIG superfamily endonuclease
VFLTFFLDIIPSLDKTSLTMDLKNRPAAPPRAAKPRYVYTLRLEDSKWYIGQSDDPERRFLQHLEQPDCEWVKKYMPLELVNSYAASSGHQELATTLEYMEKYGIDAVRGGPYTALELSSSTRSAIETLLRAGSLRCYRCGKKGHFVKSCTVPSPTSQEYKQPACYRCGRSGHKRPSCFARRHTNGQFLSDEPMRAHTIHKPRGSAARTPRGFATRTLKNTRQQHSNCIVQ